MVSKRNMTIAILACGIILAILFGLVFQNSTTFVLGSFGALFVATLFYFLYQPPSGQDCDPDTPDSNVVTWVTNEIGTCQASTCVDGYYIVKDKYGIQQCQVPTSIPPNWTTTALSNVIADSTSNLISASSTINTQAACGYACDDTDGCNFAAFSSTGCSLFTMTPLLGGPVSDKSPVTLIVRPKKG